MAWIAIDFDDTLVTKDPATGEDSPIPGAVEAMQQLTAEGHRLTVFTSRFNPMPDSEKHRVAEELQQELVVFGFPETMEVWTGTTKPSCDLFIDNNAITFDGDWDMALAQAQFMLEERGVAPEVQPYDQNPVDEGQDPGQVPDQVPEEEPQV